MYEVKRDLFDIAGRLKEIDGRYRLFFNRRLSRFEVYVNGALQVAAPYDRLDARLLDLVRRTRVENADRLIREIDENNCALDEEKIRRAAQMAMECQR